MTRQRIHDEGSGIEYFALIPHIVARMGLSSRAYHLYGYYKHLTTARGGECELSTRELAEDLGMGTASISRAKTELREAGLIRIRKHWTPTGEGDVVTCVDIWAENTFAFGKGAGTRRQRIAEAVKRIREQAQESDADETATDAPDHRTTPSESVPIWNAAPADGESSVPNSVPDRVPQWNAPERGERSKERSIMERSIKNHLRTSLKTPKNPLKTEEVEEVGQQVESNKNDAEQERQRGQSLFDRFGLGEYQP